METRQMTPFFHLLFLPYYFKINPPFSDVLSFLKIISTLSHPSPSQWISRIQTLIFLWTPKGFISPESFLNFFLNLYIPPWLQKIFKFIVLTLRQIYLWVKKLNLFIFTYASKQNSLGFLSLSSRQMGIAHSSRTAFLKIFWRKRGAERGLWSWKKYQN